MAKWVAIVILAIGKNKMGFFNSIKNMLKKEPEIIQKKEPTINELKENKIASAIQIIETYYYNFVQNQGQEDYINNNSETALVIEVESIIGDSLKLDQKTITQAMINGCKKAISELGLIHKDIESKHDMYPRSNGRTRKGIRINWK